jgi:hypothetical protein
MTLEVVCSEGLDIYGCPNARQASRRRNAIMRCFDNTVVRVRGHVCHAGVPRAISAEFAVSGRQSGDAVVALITVA